MITPKLLRSSLKKYKLTSMKLILKATNWKSNGSPFYPSRKKLTTSKRKIRVLSKNFRRLPIKNQAMRSAMKIYISPKLLPNLN